MKKKIFNSIWVMGVLALAVFCLSAGRERNAKNG